MSGIHVHFAFPSGVLSYDCTRCDQRCCKTGMLALFPRERPLLARLYPGLELATPVGAGELTFVATPYSGCWFLQAERCRLMEVKEGAARPCGCALFPFNLFGLHGEVLVVAPNTLCPLGVRGAGGVTHAEAAELLARVGMAGAPPAPVRRHDPPRAIVLERVVREAAAAAIEADSPLPFFAFMDAATSVFVKDGIPGLAALEVEVGDALLPAIERRLQRFAAVVGIAPPSSRALATVTPYVAPSLRLFAFESLSLLELPRALLALTMYLGHWHDLRPDRPLLPQGIAQVTSSLWPVLRLLAASEDRELARLGSSLPTESLPRALALRATAEARAGVES